MIKELFCAVLYAVNSAFSADSSTFTVGVAEVGSPFVPPGAFSSFKGLGCSLSPPLATFEAEWILPNQTVISLSKGRFTFLVFRDSNLLLNITKVSYADEGVYVCRFREVGSVPNMAAWVSNTTELLLPVQLTHRNNNVTVMDNETDVSLSCEMSLYLRPDEDLQWFRGDQLITDKTERYTIAYTDGTDGMGQFGGDTIGPSQISTLVISEPQTSDSDTYTCAIRDTEHSQDIQLTVESAATGEVSTTDFTTEDSMTEDPSTDDPTMEDSRSGLPLMVVYISSGAALFILVIIIIVVLTCIAMLLRSGRKSKQPNREDHVYDVIPGGTQHLTDITVGPNPAYDRADELKI